MELHPVAALAAGEIGDQHQDHQGPVEQPHRRVPNENPEPLALRRTAFNGIMPLSAIFTVTTRSRDGLFRASPVRISPDLCNKYTPARRSPPSGRIEFNGEAI